MKKFFICIVILSCILFSAILPNNIVEAASQTAVDPADFQKANPFEATISELLLAVGDFFSDMMTKIVGQEITIDGLVFNQVRAVDANFFNSGVASKNPVANVVEEVVNNWYSVFLKISISLCLIALIVVGIRMMLLSTAEKNAQAKEAAIKWILGIVILFFFPFVMKYAFTINDALVNIIADGLGFRTIAGGSVGNRDDYSLTDIEFRSPVYVSKYTGVLQYGGEEVNEIYFAKLSQYKERNDVMRIMRAYAGITLRLVYVALWYIMLIQLIVLLFKYYKRYFIIALLITVFPIVIAYYVIELVQGKKSNVFSNWSKEFFLNIFMQTIHAITYGIIAGVAIQEISEEIQSGAELGNWILMIVAVTFLFRGEDIVRKIFGADKAGTAGSALGTAASIKSGQKNVNNRFKSIGRKIEGGKFKKAE